MDVVPLRSDTPPDLLASWHALVADIDRELEPHIPPRPFDEALANHLPDDLFDRRGWLLADAGAVAGYALVELPLLENQHLALLDVRVDPGRRRAGVGTRLAVVGARAAREAGRRTVITEAVDGSPATAACEALGGKAALGSTASNLRIADLDRSLVDHWIARRDERAAAYSLVRWTSECPEELLATQAILREAMNTAPLGDLDLVIESSPQIIRATERAHAKNLLRSYVIAAQHDETGDLAALTQVVVPQGRPSFGLQEDTVVRPDHRERGLGRWVKAEMLRWLADEEPALELIATWNATENAAMRGINHELGFKPGDTWTEWQFRASDLAARTMPA